MKRTARVIITLDCKRNCPYCVNKYESIKKIMKPIGSFTEVEDYQEILITGGEPMLNPPKTGAMIFNLRTAYPKKTLYLYTAKYHHEIWKIIPFLNGVHYSIHEKATEIEVMEFHQFQDTLYLRDLWKKKSFRLYVNPENHYGITIRPKLWSRVEIKPWIPEDEMCLPPHEDLFILDLAKKRENVIPITNSRLVAKRQRRI